MKCSHEVSPGRHCHVPVTNPGDRKCYFHAKLETGWTWWRGVARRKQYEAAR